ncbi:DUF2577 family protein [Fusobacterium animalis]|uniref:DUF2577 family protein n=1 Tax=Fusobacterium animalis TaxID=76859 RepID=UPI0030D5F859
MSELGILVGEMIAQATKGSPIIKATVETPPPKLTIKFDGQTIPSEQIYCSNYLLPHYHRDYTIDGIIDNIEINVSNYDYDNTTSDTMGHGIPKLTGSGKYRGSGIYKTHKDIWLEDTLKKGDEVLVVVLGVYYIVVTKIVKMPSGAIEGV